MNRKFLRLFYFFNFFVVGISFDFETATIAKIQNSIKSGNLTCKKIVEEFLKRIENFDRQGPKLNAIVEKIQNSIEIAEILDENFSKSKNFSGFLHCVPILVKDNIDVQNVPTTGGISAFRQLIPSVDSPVVKIFRDQGAIILAKSNLAPLALDQSKTESETGGLAKNPYGLDRTTYGSSGGSAVGIAAGYAVISLDTDTTGSITVEIEK